jgi:hypothetical protein
MSTHGTPPRGLESTPRSPLFEGTFGRMFRGLPAATFGTEEKESVTNLKKLATAMKGGDDAPKDGKDDEESGIPALYTYFGQFIDHDLTFDPSSSLQKQNDPNALTDYRTPAFDLDSVYGRGPDDQPYMYNKDDHREFDLGVPLTGGAAGAQDLPRNPRNGRALIGDPRNDENSIVSQFHGLFLRFHNRLLKEPDNKKKSIEELQQIVRFHYQYVILNDFLPRIIHSEVLERLKVEGQYNKHKLEFFHWKNEPFMPVEFSVAAYRFGHSMVRPGYRLNDDTLLPIFAPKGVPSLNGFVQMDVGRGIDWSRFIDLDLRPYDGTDAENKRRLQFAYRIDTSLVEPLSNLPPNISGGSLAERNLVRGLMMRLPSGQTVAKAMGIVPIIDGEILIGSAVDKPGKPPVGILTVDGVFRENCPLWTYILAEAMKHQASVPIPVTGKVEPVNTPRLGPVGGRIVAEVFLGLMFGDKKSMLSLDPKWHPPDRAEYRLKDFVQDALGARDAR